MNLKGKGLMNYKRLRLRNGEEYKVTLDMIKLLEHCERHNIDLTECVKIEICRMEDENINNDRRYKRNHISLLNEYNNILVGESAENIVIKNLTFNQIDYYLQECTVKQRRRFIMNKVHGYTHKEIADIENVTESSVIRSITKAKKYFVEYGRRKFNID